MGLAVEELVTKGKNYLFVATNKNKEIVYWTTEIIAASIVLIYLFSIQTIKDKSGFEVYKPMEPKEALEKAKEWNKANPDIVKKIGALKNVQFNGLGPFAGWPSHINNQEYAWCTMFYLLKHLVYLVDTILTVNKGDGQTKWMDITGPLSNTIMWGTYTAYGFLYSGIQVNAGIAVKIAIETVKTATKKLSLGLINPSNDAVKLLEDKMFEIRDELQAMPYLWVLPMIVALINLGFWIFAISTKRSSLHSGQAASTWLIPIQLALFSLFSEGRLFTPNSMEDFLTKPKDADVYEGREIFCIIYYASFAGLVFSLACAYMAFTQFSKCKMTMTMWALWALLWICGFMFCLCMDTLVYDNIIVKEKLGAIIFLALGIVSAIGIAIISIMKKCKGEETEADYDAVF